MYYYGGGTCGCSNNWWGPGYGGGWGNNWGYGYGGNNGYSYAIVLVLFILLVIVIGSRLAR